MNTQRWQQVKDVLYEALERADAERPAFLEAACAGDPDLRAEVEDLIAADADAADFFEAPPPLATLLNGRSGDVDAEPGHEIGPYRLLRLLGRGGMAEVFLAERADGSFEQRVALKLVKYLDAETLLRRFEAERQILASLRHPHIARLLDGGTAEDGRPYFAMEYVEGQPLTAYARDQALPLELRLDLIAAVGEAVHHAHRNLIVHRDLKPSNILVETDDGGRPRVKLLDFGIAKVLSEEPDAHLLTETGMRPMTRAYAAPEQIRGEPVTTATDIYALGVVLYELLTGRRPFEADTQHALEQAILETEPETPSTVARRTSATEQGPTTTRLAPPAWAKDLRGDLDVICLKALRKEPADRYASAEAFVADVRRYLSGLPIEARPPTRGYRLRKYVRRHRLGVASAALGLVLLVGFSVAMAWQQTETARQRDRAERELATSETVTAFLTDLFEANRPSETRGDTLSALDLLARGRDRLAALEDQPEMHARMLYVIGRIYRSLGEYDEAAPLIEQALDERRRHLGAPHADVAESLHQLGLLRSDQGQYDEAVTFLDQALAMRRSLFGDEHPLVLETLSQLAAQHKHLGRYDEAERRFEEVLAMQRSLYGPEDPRVAYTLNNFGRLLDEMYAYDASHARYREALAILERHYEADHPEIIYTRNNIGTALYRAKRYDEAARELEEVVALRRRVFGPEHPGLATGLASLALAEYGREAFDRAIAHYDEAERIYRNAYGDEHPSIATTLFNRGVVGHKAGHWDAAEADFRAALAMRRETLGPEHVRVVHTEMYLGRLLAERNRPDAAEALYLHAMDVLLRERGPGHQATRVLRGWLADLYTATGRPEDAARYTEAEPEGTE